MNFRTGLVFGILFSLASSQYKGCDYFQALRPGEIFVIAPPRYSQNFLFGNECRWAVKVPSGNKILLNCNHEAKTFPCYGDSILVSKSGRADLSDANKYCGRVSFSESSTSTKITIAVKTEAFSTGSKLKCSLRAVADNCSCGQINRGRIGKCFCRSIC